MSPRVSVTLGRCGRKDPWARGFPILALLLLSTVPALATTVRRAGLKEIVEASDAIIEGRVESIRSFWRDRQILTEVSVVVSSAFKGSRTMRLTFLQVGGRVDLPVPIEMTVPGSPIFSVGEEAYLFLQSGKPGERYIVGLFQGHVPLRHDAQGDFVAFGGARRSPAQFEEEIRRQIAGQKLDASAGIK